MSTPYRFGRQGNTSQLQYSLPAPRAAKAPIHNPYDKFTQQEFDAWIGDITSSLKRALGEEELEQPPKITNEDVDSSSDDDEHVASQLLEDDADEESVDEAADDTFAEIRAMRVLGKGKARDPREGPGLGKGDQAQPIEILSDSDEEEQSGPPVRMASDELDEDEDAHYEEYDQDGEDEGSDDLTGEDVSEEDEEDEGLPWDGGESSAQAIQRHLSQARYLQQHISQEGDFGDEEDSQNEGAYEEGEEVYEEDELGNTPEEYSSDLRYHARTKSQSPDDDVILVESDEEDGVYPAHLQESQEHSDVGYSDDLYAEQQLSPSEPIQEERISDLPENVHQFQSNPPQYGENLEDEEEEMVAEEEDEEPAEEEPEEEEKADDDMFGPEDEEMADEIIEVEDDDEHPLEPIPDEVQPLAEDTSFPPHESISAQAELPVEIPDPWLGPQTYAQDFYSGGELRPASGLSLNAHQLGSEDVDEVQEVLNHGAQDVEMMDHIPSTLGDIPSSFPQAVFDGPIITDVPEFLIFPQIQPMETPTYAETFEGDVNTSEEQPEQPESQITVSTPTIIEAGEAGTSITIDNEEIEPEPLEGVRDEDSGPKAESNRPPILDTLDRDLFADSHYSLERDPVLELINVTPKPSDSPFVPSETSRSNLQDEERVVEITNVPKIFDLPISNTASDEQTEIQKDEESTITGGVVHTVPHAETHIFLSQDNSLHSESPHISAENGATVHYDEQLPTNPEEATKLSDSPSTPVLKDEHPVIEVTVVQEEGNGEVQPAITPIEKSIDQVQVPSIEIIDIETSQPSSPRPEEPTLLHSLSAGIQINIIEATPNVTPTPSPILHDFDETWDDTDPQVGSVAEPVIGMDWKAEDVFMEHPSFDCEVVGSYGVEEPPIGPLASNILDDCMESPENLEVEVLEETHSSIDEYLSLDGYEDSGLTSTAENLEQDKVEDNRNSPVPSHLEDLQVTSIEDPTSSDGRSSEVQSLSLLSSENVSVEAPLLSEGLEEAMDDTPSILTESMMDLATSAGDELMKSPILDAPLPEVTDPASEGTQLPPSVTEQPLAPATVVQPDVVPVEEAEELSQPIEEHGQYESDQSQVTIAEDDSPQSRYATLSSETKVGSLFMGKESETVVQQKQDALSQGGPDDLKVVVAEDMGHKDVVSSTTIIEDATSSKVQIQEVSRDDKKENAPENSITQPAALENNATSQNEADQSSQTQEEASISPSPVLQPKPDNAVEPVAGVPSSLEHTSSMGDVTTELTQKATHYLDERASTARDEAQTSLPEVPQDSAVSKNTMTANTQISTLPEPAHNEANHAPYQSQVNGSSSSHIVFSSVPEEAIPVQMFMRGPSQPLLMADPYPWSLSTPSDPYTGSRYTAYDSEAGSPVTSSSSTSAADNILDPQLQRDKPIENGTTIHTNAVPGGHSENVAGSAPQQLPTEATSLSPRLLTAPSSSNAPRVQHGSSSSYKQSPSNRDSWKKQHDAPQSSPRSSISGTRITSVEPQVQTEEELPSILIIKKPNSPTKSHDQEGHEEQSPALKRKREPAAPAIMPSSTSKKGPGRPRGKKVGKAEASQPPKKAPKPRKEKGKGKEAGQPDVRSTSSRDTPSRASSIASSVPSEVAHQSSPSIALKEPQFRPPAPPPPRTMPPSLMHRHSHALPQSSSANLPPQRSSSHRHAGSEATPSRPQATSQRERGSFTSYSSPVTRSNCRYHKISIPRDEDGPRIMFLVPGCTLGDQELIEEEEINDLGDATVEDTRDIIQDLDSLDFEPYLIGVLRQLVGAKMLQEREVYYMSRKGEDGKDLVPRKSSWSPSKGRSHLQHAEHSSKAAESPTTPTGPRLPGLETDSSSEEEADEDEYQPRKKTRGTLSRRATHPASTASSRGVKRSNTSVAHEQELDAARQAKKQKTNGGEEHEEPGPVTYPPPIVFIPFKGPTLA